MSFNPKFSSVLATALKAQETLVKNTKQLEHAVTNSAKQGIPHIAIGPAQGQFISQLCRLANAKSILELGTLGGYSTIWLATSVPGVKVTSIEYNSKHRDVALENVAGLDNVDIRLGAALDVLPVLAKEGAVYDFVFIDADWDEQQQYFDWAVKLTRPGGVIYVDNVVRQLTECEDGDARAWALIDHVKNDSRVTPTMISTLNTEKENFDDGAVDGFLLALVN